MEPVGLWLIAGAAALLAYGSYRSKRQRSDELEVLASELGLRVGEDEGCLLYTSPSPRD